MVADQGGVLNRGRGGGAAPRARWGRGSGSPSGACLSPQMNSVTMTMDDAPTPRRVWVCALAPLFPGPWERRTEILV